METITKTYEVYNFDELNKEAKEHAKENYLMDDSVYRNEDFYDACKEMLKADFPNSNLNLQYSLTYCQGDGVNIYGKLNLTDLFPFIEKQYKKGYYTEKEVSRLKWYCQYVQFFELDANNRYCYSRKFLQKKEAPITWALEDDDIQAIDYALIDRFQRDFLDYLESIEREIEKDGYDYLYNIDDEEFSEIADSNRWLFDENGILFH